MKNSNMQVLQMYTSNFPLKSYFKVGYRPVFIQILTKTVIFAETHLQIIKVILLVTNHCVKVVTLYYHDPCKISYELNLFSL